MAKIAPPVQKKTASKNIKKPLPKATKAIEQIPPEAIKPLQLKIPEAAKNEFKAYAAMRGKSMNTLFLEMFEAHKEIYK